MFKRICCFVLFFLYFFLFKNSSFAINKIYNPNFSSANGWTATNGSSTNVCGGTQTETATSFTTFGWNSSSNYWKIVTARVASTTFKGMIGSTFSTGGTSGIVKAKGKFVFVSTGGSYGSANTSWVRLDVYDSTNTNFVAALRCFSFNSDQVQVLTFGSDVGLSANTTYTARVSTTATTGATKGIITITLDGIIVNVAPVGLAATTPVETTNAKLDWTASVGGSGAAGLGTTSYVIYRNLTSPVSTKLGSTNTNTYTDTTSVGNTGYYFAIVDIDSDGDTSPPSAEVYLLTLPGQVSTPTFSLVTGSSLRVGWTAPSGGAASYKVHNCSGSGCSNFSVIRSGETNLYYDHSPLTGTTVYRYKIQASNASGDGAYSGIGETTTLAGVEYSLTVTSADKSIEYGVVGKNSSKSTIDVSNTQTVQNNSSATEKINIQTSNATGGTTWTVGTSTGENVYVHEFSTNSGGNWTKFNTAESYQTLVASITAGNSQNFDLRITVPTESDINQKTITITVQAAAP